MDEQQLAYWRSQLAGVPTVLELPTDFARPALQSYRGAHTSFALSPALSQALHLLSKQAGVTLYMTLLAAFQTLLGHYTGQDDLVVGTPSAGRATPEVEGLIGFFVNTLVMRADLAGNPTFRQVLSRVQDTALGAYAHQDIPFERIVEELHSQRSFSHHPLVQVAFTLENVLLDQVELAALDLDIRITRFDLAMLVWEEADHLVGVVEYSTDLFTPTTIQRLLGHWQDLCAALVAAPDLPLSLLPWFSEAERQQVLVEWNATTTDAPLQAGIAQLFAEQVAQRPEAIALVCGESQLTYQELDQRATQLAWHLRELGVGPEVPVGLCLERSLELVLAVLAILKAGGAYVPLDPDAPAERLAFLLTDARVCLLLTQTHLATRLGTVPVECLLLDQDWGHSPQVAPHAAPPPGAASGEHLAYVMYTSGSTGTPKGVSVTQRNVVRLVKATSYATLSAAEVFLHFAPLSFDASTFELWGCLLNGGRLVVVPAGLPTLQELAQCLQRFQITTLWLTAGLFHQMVEEHLPSLGLVRQLLAGGDVLSVPHVERVLAQGATQVLINGYGPTENTTFTCCQPLRPGDAILSGGSVPIGRPIANTRVYLLDRWGQPVPVGVPGELFLGGEGVARGYLNRPALTAERFVPDPFSGQPGERLYRTGDQARYRSDGSLEFLGRLDQQVKVRGYRIELGEIATDLLRQPQVQAAVVVVQQDASGDKRLVAYVVGEEPVSQETLRKAQQQRLPTYMLPAAYVQLPALPLTANGKVDERALPPPQWGQQAEGAEHIEGPRTPMEEQLAAIWCQVLQLKRVGRHENFFALGGHSLLATQVASSIRKTLTVEIPLRVLFEAPSIASLAEYLQESCLHIQEVNNEDAFHIKVLSRGNGDVDQLVDSLEQLSEEEIQMLLTEDAWLEDDSIF
jgi:amino acid adenylation domain-containing protein